MMMMSSCQPPNTVSLVSGEGIEISSNSWWQTYACDALKVRDWNERWVLMSNESENHIRDFGAKNPAADFVITSSCGEPSAWSPFCVWILNEKEVENWQLFTGWEKVERKWKEIVKTEKKRFECQRNWIKVCNSHSYLQSETKDPPNPCDSDFWAQKRRKNVLSIKSSCKILFRLISDWFIPDLDSLSAPLIPISCHHF